MEDIAITNREENKRSLPIKKYFAAYESNDWKTIDELLSDDFRFSSPDDPDIDKATYSGSAGQPVKAVLIPKKVGGSTPLSIPTLLGRIAQQVAKHHLEKQLEPQFHESSYGYRPGRSG